MKKIIITLLILTILISLLIYTINRDKNEALKLFNEHTFFYVELHSNVDNIDEIKQKIMKMHHVRSVIVDKVKNDLITELNLGSEYFDKLPTSFLVNFKFKSKDLDNLKEIQNDLLNEIGNIEHVRTVKSSDFNHLINIYNAKGVNGLKEFCDFFEKTENMSEEELVKYYEDNADFLNEYRKYKYE